MYCLHANASTHQLNLLGIHLQQSYHTCIALPLCVDRHHCACRHVVFCVWELCTGRGETRTHELGPGEHEADRTAVNLQGWEALREAVNEAQVREKGVVVMLEEEDIVVKGVESDAFRAREDV